MTLQEAFEAHGVPEEQWPRLCIVLSSLNYAEHMIGGIITGGASLEELQTWHRMADMTRGVESQPVTLDELRVLERCNLVHDDAGTWRGIIGREDPSRFFQLT